MEKRTEDCSEFELVLRGLSLFYEGRELEALDVLEYGLGRSARGAGFNLTIWALFHRAVRWGSCSEIPAERMRDFNAHFAVGAATFVGTFYGSYLEALAGGPFDLPGDQAERLEVLLRVNPYPKPFVFVERLALAPLLAADPSANAQERLEQCIRAEPNYVEALLMYARLQLPANPARALEFAGRAVAVNPRSAFARRSRGLLFEAAGRPYEAYEDFRAALMLHPKCRVACRDLFRVSRLVPGGAFGSFAPAIAAAPFELLPAIVEELREIAGHRPWREILPIPDLPTAVEDLPMAAVLVPECASPDELALGLSRQIALCFSRIGWELTRRSDWEGAERAFRGAHAEIDGALKRPAAIEGDGWVLCTRERDSYLVDVHRRARAARVIFFALLDARYRPGGPGFEAARAHFRELQDQR